MEQLQGKVAVVTGAASGIGKAMATRFAAEGMAVVLADIEAEPLDEALGEVAAHGGEVMAVECDVADADEVDALRDAAVDAFGTVHVVCNNAGVAAGGRSWEISLDDWEWVLGVNLRGVIHGIRSFVPVFLDQDEGHVVNTASMAGLTSAPTMGPYNVSKHGVVTLSETLYAELAMAGSNVGVSVLCPGWIRTRIAESHRNRPGAAGDPEVEPTPEALAIQEFVSQLVAEGREPAEVAGLVVDAVRSGGFYILTHPEWNRMITNRTERIVAGENPDLGMSFTEGREVPDAG